MLLAIDTSTRSMGVALYEEPRVLSEVTWVSGFYHTVELAPLVQTSMEKLGVKPDDLTAVAVATGPGSFTGLRIGLAYAKGMYLSLGIPIIGIPTLDILAKAQPPGDYQLAAVIEAGRQRFAVGWYEYSEDQWQRTGEIENYPLEELVAEITVPTRVCGELDKDARKRLSRKYKNVILAPPSASVRRPAVLAELAWARYKNKDLDDPDQLAPYYLHHGDPIPG